MDNYVVYKHINKINNKIYIGITNNTKRRWANNGREYKPSNPERQNRPFWNAIQKYGFDNFEHIVVQSGMSFEHAINAERDLIARENSTDKRIGYNVSEGGNGGHVYKIHPHGMAGKSQTAHQIATHREWSSNPDNNPMKNGQVVWGKTHDHPKGMLGKKQSDAHAQAMAKKSGKNNHNSVHIVVTKPDGSRESYYGFRELQDKTGIGYVLSHKLIDSGEPYRYTGHTAKRYAQYEGYRIYREDSVLTHQISQG